MKIRNRPKNSWAHLQISSYFGVFWGKIQLSSGHKVSWFRVGWKILLNLIFPHVGLSSMPFWSKYTDPPTFMKCGINFLKMLIIVIYVAFSFIYTIFLKEYTSEIFYLIISIPLASSTFDLMQSGVHLEVTQSLACKNIPAILLDYILDYFFCCQNSNITWLFINLFSIN